MKTRLYAFLAVLAIAGTAHAQTTGGSGADNPLLLPAGAAGTPSIADKDNPDTGIFFEASTVSIATGGVRRLAISDSTWTINSSVNLWNVGNDFQLSNGYGQIKWSGTDKLKLSRVIFATILDITGGNFLGIRKGDDSNLASLKAGAFTMDDEGTNVNSPTFSLKGDDGGVEEEASLYLVQGADPYLRLSVDDDNTSPVLTAVLDIHDTVIANSTPGLTALGSTSNYFSNVITQAQAIMDTGNDHYLTLSWNEDNGANAQLRYIFGGDHDHTVTLDNDLTVEGASTVNQDLTTDADVQFNQVQTASTVVQTTKSATTTTTFREESVTFSGGGGDASKTTVANMFVQGEILIGLSSRVTTTGTNCAGYHIGITPADIDLFGADIGVSQGTTSDNSDWTSQISYPTDASLPIIVTGTDGAGTPTNCVNMVVAITAHLIQIGAATSN